MKIVNIAGRLGKDSELRNTSGDSILSFTVAVDDGYGDNKKTMWFDCSLWGKRGERLAGILTKGTPVTVCGTLGSREYNGKTYMTVRVIEVTLHGGRGGQQDNSHNPQQSSYGQSSANNGFDDDLSDIPF